MLNLLSLVGGRVAMTQAIWLTEITAIQCVARYSVTVLVIKRMLHASHKLVSRTVVELKATMGLNPLPRILRPIWTTHLMQQMLSLCNPDVCLWWPFKLNIYFYYSTKFAYLYWNQVLNLNEDLQPMQVIQCSWDLWCKFCMYQLILTQYATAGIVAGLFNNFHVILF